MSCCFSPEIIRDPTTGGGDIENWPSEFLQLLAFVVLTAYFIHRGSHESRDGDDELKAMLSGIDERLARVEHALSPTRVSAGERR